MKKLIFILAIVFSGMLMKAQSDYTYSLTTKDDASGTLWDYADTLTNGETIDAFIRVRGNTAMNLRFQVVLNNLSGTTSSATVTTFGSNDGATYIATGDSITAAISADGSVWVLARNFNYSYYKLLLTTAGTETSVAKVFYSFRKE
jgi:hypothetical protein